MTGSAVGMVVRGVLLGVAGAALVVLGLGARAQGAGSAPPRARVEHGVYVPSAAQEPALLDAWEAATGVRAEIVHWYQPWGFDDGGWYRPRLDRAALEAVAARGATPLITWEAWGSVAGRDPSRLALVARGDFDAYVDEWAAGLKDFGGPVYLRPYHEMNNPTYPWSYGQNRNEAADLVAAWRHLHGRFARAGATNVRWVWSPNTENDLAPYAQLYPGDAYVDWLAVDGYNGGDLFPWGGWLTPVQLFGRSYTSLRALSQDKPIMIAETSSVESGGSKAEWIKDLYIDVPTRFPAVRAIVWFDADITGRPDHGADWRIATSPAALQAYGDAVRSALSGMPATSSGR